MELIGEAEDGVQAVLLARSLKPDVILLDLMMPRMDGIQAISEIKRENPAARILVLTSFAGDDKVFPAIKAGALWLLAQRLIVAGAHPGETTLTVAQVFASPDHRPQIGARVSTTASERRASRFNAHKS